MSRFLATKHFGSLRPTDPTGEAVLAKLKQGAVVTVEVKQPRNGRHHRMFFALLNLVWENVDHERYPTMDDLLAAIKFSAGLRKRIVMPNGSEFFIPGSIAFHKMDQTEFTAFYDRVCDLIARHFLPGVTSDELRHEVELMIGTARAA